MGRKRNTAGQFIYLYYTCLIFFAISGCAISTRIGNEITARSHLMRGNQLFEQRNFEGSLKHYDEVIILLPDSSPGDEALFRMGLLYSHYENPGKDLEKALGYFRRLVKDFPDSPRVEEAEIWVGILGDLEKEQRVGSRYLRSGELAAEKDFERLLRQYNKILSQYPDSSPGDEALFRMGLLYSHYENPGKDLEKALGYFRRLVKDFPDSPRVEEAEIWVGILGDLEKERSVGSRYLRSGELAAEKDFERLLRQYNKILSQYPDSSPGDEALFRMGLLYSHYENPGKDLEKALGYFRRLVKDFPDSPRIEEAKIWVETLTLIEKSKQADIEIEEKKKELSR